MNWRNGDMRATRRCLDRSTADIVANTEYVESVRDASDQLALLGMRMPESRDQDASLGGSGGGGPMEGTGDGGGMKPPMKGSAMGPTSSTGWKRPSGPRTGVLHRASSCGRGAHKVNGGGFGDSGRRARV